MPYFRDAILDGPFPLFDKTESALVGISVKNRRFSRSFLIDAVRLCRDYCREAVFVVFDYPYAFNEAAKRGDHVCDKDFAHVCKIGDEREISLRRIIKNESAHNIKIKRWNFFSSIKLIEDLRLEMRQAFAHNSDFKKELYENVKVWRDEISHEEFFLEFQFQEIPVILYLYYYLNFLIDIYPGLNFTLFREIEAGVWKRELPKATSLCNNKRIVTINVVG